MKPDDSTQLLVDIAHMYYEQNLTQSQISRKLNISRSSISKMLTRAHRMGIVEIVIHDENIHPFHELENSLKEKFRLQHVICIDNEYEELLIHQLGLAASRYLAKKLEGKKTIAIAGGRTTNSMASNIVCAFPHEDITFVPISGGLGDDFRYMQAVAICEMLAHETGGHFMTLHAPLFVDSPQAREILIQQSFIKNVLDSAKNADLAIVGLGSPDSHMTYVQNMYKNQESHLRKYSSVIQGDLSYNLFDKNGKSIDCNWNKCLISLNIQEISNIREVVVVAGGLKKAESLYIAATHNYLNTLITDALTAKKLLSLASI